MSQLVLTPADIGKHIKGHSDFWSQYNKKVEGCILIDGKGYYYAPDPCDSNNGHWLIAYANGLITNFFTITSFDGRPWPYPPKDFKRLNKFKDGSRDFI